MPSYISGRLFRLGFILVLALLANLLRLVIDRKSKKQKIGEHNGRITMRQPSGAGILLLALGLMMFGFIMFLLMMISATGEGAEAWEQAGPMIVLVVAIVVLWVVAGGWFCYYLRAYTIVFDREKIVVSKPFKKDDEIPWSSLSRMELQAARSILYDRYGQERLKVASGWENFGLFCQVAKERIETNRDEAIGW